MQRILCLAFCAILAACAPESVPAQTAGGFPSRPKFQTVTSAGALTVSSGGANITGNTTITGTLSSGAQTISSGGETVTGGLSTDTLTVTGATITATSAAATVSTLNVAAGPVKAMYTAIKPATTGSPNGASNITLTADPNLVLNSVPIGLYALECWLNFNNASVGGAGFQFSFTFSGTAGATRAQSGWVNAATFTTANTVALGSATQFATITTLAAGDWVLVKGYLSVTAAGNLTLNWSQVASNAAVTQLLLGSYLTLTRLN